MHCTRRHLAEGVIEHVAPVAEHVGDDPAAVLRAVVPRRTLRGLPAPVALEHPVAELTAHAEDAAEEAGVDEPLELADARQEQLVLHDAVLHARLVGEAREVERLLRADRRAASRSRRASRARSRGARWPREAASASRRSRSDRSRSRAPSRGRSRRARCRTVVGERAQLALVAPDEDRIGHEARAVGHRNATLLRGSRRSSARGAG